MLKRLLLIVYLICFIPAVFADDIAIADFDELINSSPQSGDTLIFTNDLDSTSSIGNYFSNLDINFEGNNYYINGDETFGGFVLNSTSTFNQVGIRFCQGQTLNNSKYAGAIFNNGGNSLIENSAPSNPGIIPEFSFIPDLNICTCIFLTFSLLVTLSVIIFVF